MSTDVTHILFGYSQSDAWAFTQGMSDTLALDTTDITDAAWSGEWSGMTSFTLINGGVTRNHVLGSGASDNQLFIQQITDYGALGAETDRRNVGKAFNVACSYAVGGQTYVFLHCTKSKDFAIYHITADGKLDGSPKQSGTWGDAYPSMFAVNVGGNVYIGGQSTTDKKFFLQPITAAGTLGSSESCTQNWGDFYSTLLPIQTANHVYLFGQSSDGNHWFVQEILSTGKLASKEASSGNWAYLYDSAAGFRIGQNSYIFAQTSKTKRWFTQILNDNGVFAAQETTSGEFGNFYSFFAVLTTPPLQAVDNWMTQIYDTILKDKTLKQIVMPGSHDAGMSSPGGCTTWANSSNTGTQGMNVWKQLSAGSRYFDLRPMAVGSNPVTYRTAHFSNVAVVGWQGCNGESIDDIINDVISFATVPGRSKELIILKFSHYLVNQGSDYSSGWTEEQKKSFADYVAGRLSSVLITYTGADRVGAMTYETLMGLGAAANAKVLLVFDGIGSDVRRPAGGVFSYSDYPGTQADLTVYDEYSGTDDYNAMSSDQYTKLENANNHNGDMFLLSWTLTQTGLSSPSIHQMAGRANGELVGTLNGWADIGAITKQILPNVIYVDYVTNQDAALSRALLQRIYLGK